MLGAGSGCAALVQLHGARGGTGARLPLWVRQVTDGMLRPPTHDGSQIKTQVSVRLYMAKAGLSLRHSTLGGSHTSSQESLPVRRFCGAATRVSGVRARRLRVRALRGAACGTLGGDQPAPGRCWCGLEHPNAAYVYSTKGMRWTHDGDMSYLKGKPHLLQRAVSLHFPPAGPRPVNSY